MKIISKVCVGLLLLPAACLWAQVDDASTRSPQVNSDNGDNRMLTPAPVNGQSYPALYTAGERSNYVRGGMAFSSAYSDNVLGSSTANP